MFDRKSGYALNKRHPEAIVYRSVTQECIQLTRADFSSGEEFAKWKEWSDLEYRQTEKLDRMLYDKWTSLSGCVMDELTEPSAEERLLWLIDRADQNTYRAKRIRKIKVCLSPAQFRRLWMRCAEGKSVTEIAKLEGISKAGVSLSLRAAREKINATFIKP